MPALVEAARVHVSEGELVARAAERLRRLYETPVF